MLVRSSSQGLARRPVKDRVIRRVAPMLGRGFDRFAHGISRAGYPLLPLVVPSFRGVDIEFDVPYLPTCSFSHLLDIYRPKGRKGKLPTVFYVHGGGFSTCSKDTHRIMAYMLAANGYQVFMVNYRVAPVAAFPKPLEDVTAAFHWFLDHGAEHGADLDRVAIMGESAGANLVTALAVAATEPRKEPYARSIYQRAPNLRAVVAIYGLLDCTDIERLWRSPRKERRMAGWVKEILRWTAASYVGDPKRAAEQELASPLLLLERPAPAGARSLPPFFASVGTSDPLLSDSVRLRAAVERRGGEAELHVFPGEIHAFNALLFRRAAREKWRLVVDFLDHHVGGPGIEVVRESIPAAVLTA